MTSPILIRSINEFLDLYAKADRLLSGISMLYSSEQDKESSKRFLIATRSLHMKVTKDFLRDIPATPILRKRSYLVTRDTDRSLDLIDVKLTYQQSPLERANILQCQGISKMDRL